MLMSSNLWALALFIPEKQKRAGRRGRRPLSLRSQMWRSGLTEADPGWSSRMRLLSLYLGQMLHDRRWLVIFPFTWEETHRKSTPNVVFFGLNWWHVAFWGLRSKTFLVFMLRKMLEIHRCQSKNKQFLLFFVFFFGRVVDLWSVEVLPTSSRCAEIYLLWVQTVH